MFGIGSSELLILGVIALLLFGNRLPQVMRSLGQGVTEFKKGLDGISEEMHRAPAQVQEHAEHTPAKLKEGADHVPTTLDAEHAPASPQQVVEHMPADPVADRMG
jgi:TatA/E family protein of Tat protein translocase